MARRELRHRGGEARIEHQPDRLGDQALPVALVSAPDPRNEANREKEQWPLEDECVQHVRLLVFGGEVYSIQHMRRLQLGLLVIVMAVLTACNTNKKKEQPPIQFLSAKETVLLNQLVYKDTIKEAFANHAPGYELVFLPHAVNGNYAAIVKNKTTDQYAFVMGSVIEFSNAGFQNFILQDFNIFTIKP